MPGCPYIQFNLKMLPVLTFEISSSAHVATET